jgi:hypothetical protein
LLTVVVVVVVVVERLPASTVPPERPLEDERGERGGDGEYF